MIITLIGYMGSGKSLIASKLSEATNIPHLDTDQEISKRNKCSIVQMFQSKGELYFRRKEKELLEEILAKHKPLILSVGGGTPCYYNNMELLNANTHTIFLQATAATLAKHLLLSKHRRPLIANIADENLIEFIAKHLFERNPFYTQAQTILPIQDKMPEQITSEIIQIMNKEGYI